MRYIITLAQRATGTVHGTQQASSRAVADALFNGFKKIAEPGDEITLVDTKLEKNNGIADRHYRPTVAERTEQVERSLTSWLDNEVARDQMIVRFVDNLKTIVGDMSKSYEWELHSCDDVIVTAAKVDVAREFFAQRQKGTTWQVIYDGTRAQIRRRSRSMASSSSTSTTVNLWERAALEAWAHAEEAIRQRLSWLDEKEDA